MLYAVLFTALGVVLLALRSTGSLRYRAETLLRERTNGRIAFGLLYRSALIFWAASALALVFWVGESSDSIITDNGCILREERGGGSVTVHLYAETEDGGKINVEADISPRRYGQEELEDFFEAMVRELEQQALGENDAWERITEDLRMSDSVEGYPFLLEWSCRPYGLVSSDGTVTAPDQPATVRISVKATCEGFEREHFFDAVICPREKETSMEGKVQEALRLANEAQPEKEEVLLPKMIDGKNIIWAEEKEYSSPAILLLGACAAVCACIFAVKERENRQKERREKMEAAYGTIVGKLSLYLDAGLNVRGAWEKITKEGRENPIYEEMQITVREMEGGIGEAEAYERFGKRVLLQRYVRLGTLLVQNLQKGNAALLVQLHQEVLLSGEELAASVRRKGEEISTKLLLPMMLLLGIVMVWIMIPAFLSL